MDCNIGCDDTQVGTMVIDESTCRTGLIGVGGTPRHRSMVESRWLDIQVGTMMSDESTCRIDLVAVEGTPRRRWMVEPRWLDMSEGRI